MNDEIKEIYLSDLEWTKTHDNIGGVMGNLIFKDNMPYEEYQELFKTTYFVLCNKDYITNLQKENNHKDKLIDIANAGISNLQQENDNYKSRAEKAIEIIDLMKPELWNISNKMTYKLIDIKNILQNGSEKND